MLKKITEDMKNMVLDYLADDILNCVYLYINLYKYGVVNQNINSWLEISDEEIKCVIVKYFNGIQIYSKNNDFNEYELYKIVDKINPSVISGNSYIIDKIVQNNRYINKEYKREDGFVAKLNSLNLKDVLSDIQRCKSNIELYDISKLICTDDGLGRHYSLNELYNQLYERKNDNFGRNYFISGNNKIISHAATYAEIKNIAVIGGVITDYEHRGKGLAKEVVSKLCKDLVNEGKDIYLFYDDEVAGKIYRNIGFNQCNSWSKLKKEKL